MFEININKRSIKSTRIYIYIFQISEYQYPQVKIWWTQYPLWDIGWTSLLVPVWLAARLIWHLDGIISFSGESLLIQAHCILATHNWRKCTDMNQHYFPHESNSLKQYWCVNYVPRFFSMWINSWGTNDCACFDSCTAISEHIFYLLIKSYCTLWYWQYDISKLNFMYQNCILLHISLKLVPKV